MKQRFETFTVLINRISRNIRKIKNQEMAEYKLRSIHISCLYHLHLSDGLTATDLCELCAEDKATISRSIDYLEKNGYLTSKSPNSKKYKTPLVLTQYGREVGKKIADKVECVLGEISTGMNEEERLRFYRSLAIIDKKLQTVVNKA